MYYQGYQSKRAAIEYTEARDAADRIGPAPDPRLQWSRDWLAAYMAAREAARVPRYHFKVSIPETQTTEIIDGEFTEVEAGTAAAGDAGEGVGDAPAAAKGKGEDLGARAGDPADWIEEAIGPGPDFTADDPLPF